MNEQIRELEIQCWEDTSPPWAENVSMEFNIQKFAELLIQDCLEQVNQAIPDTECAASGIYKTARISAISRIKQHFGVE